MTKVTHGSIDGLLSARWEARIPSTARGHDVVKTAAMESTALLLKRMLWDMQDNDNDVLNTETMATGG